MIGAERDLLSGQAGVRLARPAQDFPAWQTVYTDYRRWVNDGTWDAIHDRLRAWIRVSEGRQESPSEVILDSQSVATAPMVHRAVGFDAAKKTKGRKRHCVVDTLSLVMAVVITAASVTERDGGKLALQKLHQMGVAMARLYLVWMDGGYSGFKVIQRMKPLWRRSPLNLYEARNREEREAENLEGAEPEELVLDEEDLSLNESRWLEVIEISELEDEREKDLKLVVIREGQAAFRENLLAAHDGRCAITGYSVKDVLEAAHIVPYLGVKTNHLSNGLILRSDLHKLFDSFKIAINPDTLTVCVAPELMNTEYRDLHGRQLRNVRPNYPPVSRPALRYHLNQCAWIRDGGLHKHEAQ